MTTTTTPRFEAWRAEARSFLLARTPPSQARFGGAQASLFGAPTATATTTTTTTFTAPRAFLDLARTVSCHTASDRNDLLYRLLWRLQDKRDLLDDAADVDVCAARRLEKGVHRDIHKLHAFVRFREAVADDGVACLVAFHRPDFFVVEAATPFFARRFPNDRWSIATPKGTASFIDGTLQFGAAVDVDPFAGVDDVEELWRTYYGAIFNPARARPEAMRAEMPIKHWRTLPEARLIPELLQQAQQRTSTYVDADSPKDGGARPFIPKQRVTLPQLREAAVGCTGCALSRTTATSCPTQVVFGEGPDDARIVIVGEQPGDEEDKVGRPFVGPAGRLLDELLRDAGLDRAALYLTNTVKHFRHTLTTTTDGAGRPKKHRLHERPAATDVRACRPWLEREIATLQPTTILCLGQTAARAVVDPRAEVRALRGQVVTTSFAPRTIVSWHPAAILRADDATAMTMRAELLADLRLLSPPP
ncbi:MAG TPA: UdgX family uracil-DNA binding protein [Myxococcota bacterium]